ncbi:HAD family hydrolase [Natronomonas sp. EA1]|uniref:HAD family hydrolase n=1 Tax=Natronomonas sp. EA1 TaxID=3421655 RepID=UPI003EBAB251
MHVFDLDNTLVRLTVDWEQVAQEAAAALREEGVDPPHDLWGMLDVGDETGTRHVVEAVISAHEREGAHASERLPAADRLPEGPVGVCSLNCTDACHIALDRHDIEVDAVVGRDSGPWEKPDPEPLLATIDALGGDPSEALFIGDSETDERCAERAGVAFLYVDDWLAA